MEVKSSKGERKMVLQCVSYGFQMVGRVFNLQCSPVNHNQSVQSLWYQKATWAHPLWLSLAHSLLKPQPHMTVYAYLTLWAVECTVRGASRSFSVTVFKLYYTWLPGHESSGFPLTLMTPNVPLQVLLLYKFL